MSTKLKSEWFDNEAFWRDMYPLMFPEECFSHALPQIEKLLSLAKPVGKDALDLCCGPGRHSIALAKAGFRVTGVDKTEYLLDQARARAKAAGADIEWVKKDMRDFTRADAYDIVINMYTSFGYFDDKDDDLRVLGNVAGSLKPGGVCMIDIIGKEYVAKSLPLVTWELLPDGAKLIQRHEIFDAWTRIRSEWILIRGSRAKSFKFHHTIYSGQELKDRMGQAGFADVKLYGNLDGAEYGPDAAHIIAVGRRAQ